MKVAVVGATGMVGHVMLQLLAERNFPVSELLPVASERSVGKTISFKGNAYPIISMSAAIDQKPDLAIFSAGGSTSLKWAPKFAAIGTTVITGAQPPTETQYNSITVPLVSNAASTETGGGFQCTIGPINDKA